MPSNLWPTADELTQWENNRGEPAAQPRRGRKPIGDRPMTTAERKARSRALILGALAGDLEQAHRLATQWRQCLKNGRPGATDADIQEAFTELANLIASAQLQIPQA